MKRLFILLLLSLPLVAEDWILIIKDGQSLSIGVAGDPSLSTTQPFSNLMFTPCGIAMTTTTALIEPPPPYAPNFCDFGTVESGAASLGNTATRFSVGNSQIYVVDVVGVSGAAYSLLAKTGGNNSQFGESSYNYALDIVTHFKAAAISAGKTYKVGAIFINLGQTDMQNGASADTWEGDMVEWQANFNTDIKAITGQTQDVPLVLSQWSSWTKYIPIATPTGFGAGYSGVPSTPIGIWQAAKNHFPSIILSGPEYPYPTNGGVHLTNSGYRWMGSRDGYITDWIARQGKGWHPVAPREMSISGTTITAKFWVPSGCLALDTTLVSDPGNKGFEFHQSGASPPTISSVTVTSCDTVTIALSGATSGTVFLAYAFTGIINNNGGPTTGPRGNLRDTSTATNASGDPLYNWAVTFNEPLPFSWESDSVTQSGIKGASKMLGSGKVVK